jgi:hypothetical protein
VSGIQGHNYTLSTLINLLTKREYVYREYFLNKGFSINLPKYLLSTPSNSLLNEVKKSYSFVDPTNFIGEVQRDLFYNNITLYNFNLINKVIQVSNSLPTSTFLNNLFLYIFNTDISDKIGENDDLYKNQFRPMRKGISNMIRLHATGAIAMPIEIRLHILASSKDIIHS